MDSEELSPETANRLLMAGYVNRGQVVEATNMELKEIDWIGMRRVKQIREVIPRGVRDMGDS